MNTKLHICDVCRILDHDKTLKECFFCPRCDAWICVEDQNKWTRRTAAFMSRQWIKHFQNWRYTASKIANVLNHYLTFNCSLKRKGSHLALDLKHDQTPKNRAYIWLIKNSEGKWVLSRGKTC